MEDMRQRSKCEAGKPALFNGPAGERVQNTVEIVGTKRYCSDTCGRELCRDPDPAALKPNCNKKCFVDLALQDTETDECVIIKPSTDDFANSNNAVVEVDNFGTVVNACESQIITHIVVDCFDVSLPNVDNVHIDSCGIDADVCWSHIKKHPEADLAVGGGSAVPTGKEISFDGEAGLDAGSSKAGITAGEEHPELQNENADWFRILGPEENRVINEKLVCSLWAIDRHAGVCTEIRVNVFEECLLGTCDCRHFVGGAVSQIKPCRVFAKAFCLLPGRYRPGLGICIARSLLRV